MRRTGRPPAETPEEREQVLALADKHVPHREIAEQVFGNARYRGRVERILRERLLARHPEPTQEHASWMSSAEEG
jgi:hypothetical protein